MKSPLSLIQAWTRKAGALMSVLVICSFASETQAAVLTVPVDAGSLTSIGGTSVWDAGSTFVADYTSGQTDGRIHLLLDLGSVEHVTAVEYVNRLAATNLVARGLEIYTAPDESLIGFDPLDVASYTVLVFSGDLAPAVTTAGAVRTATLTTTATGRYLLLDFTSNMNGSIAHVSNRNLIQFSDIRVTVDAIPEPSSYLLGLSGGLLGLVVLRKARRRA